MAAEGSVHFSSGSQRLLEGLPSLLDFSNEILIYIIQYVVNTKSLLSLTLCSRQFHELTEPILYAEFKQRGPKSLPTFLCRLLARPDLASRTKLFNGWACNKGADEQDVSALGEDDWTRVRTALFAASIDGDQGALWMSAVEQGMWDPLAALLLSIAPNLKEVTFQDWGYSSEEGETPFIDDIIERAADLQNRGERSPYSLSNLERVSLDYWDTENGMSFSKVEPFLKLKSVTEFEAFAVSEDNHDQFQNAQPLPFTFQTKGLTLKNTVIGSTDIAYRFKAFECLERLYYEHGPATVGYSTFEPPRMMAALAHLKPCLKDLTILIDEYMTYSGAAYEQYPIGSLAGFENLTSVDVTTSLMIGEDPEDEDDDDNNDDNEDGFLKYQILADSLPPRLKYLSLRNVQPEHRSQIFSLVAQKTEKAPFLTQLNLQWEDVIFPDKPSPKVPIHHPGFTKEHAEELMAACAAAGLEIVIDYLLPMTKSVVLGRELTEEEYKLNGSEFSRPIRTTEMHSFQYPYEGFREFCRVWDLNSETTGSAHMPL